MKKQDIQNHYFASRAFKAGTDSFLMTASLRSVMPSLSNEDAEKLANMFAEKLKGYMGEAQEYAEKVGE